MTDNSKLTRLGLLRKLSPNSQDEVYCLDSTSKRNLKKSYANRQSDRSVFQLVDWRILRRPEGQEQKVEISFDLKRFAESLRSSLAKNFGIKSKFVVKNLSDKTIKFQLIIVQERHISLEQDRGYGVLSHGWSNPLGVFACEVELGTSGKFLSVSFFNHFVIGYLDKYTIENLMKSFLHAFQLSDKHISAALNSANLYEIRIPFADILSTALELTKSKSEILHQILEEIAGLHSYGVDLRLNSEKKSWAYLFDSHDRSYNLDNSTPIKILESRENTGVLSKIDGDLIRGKQPFIVDKIDTPYDFLSEAVREKIAMASFLNDRPLLLPANSTNMPCSILERCYRLYCISESSEKAVENASSLMRSFIDIYGPVEEDTQVFRTLSEFIGDIWSQVDVAIAEKAYTGILELGEDSPRILRKLLSLFEANHCLEKQAVYLQKILDVEPRSVEKSKIFIKLSELYRKKNDLVGQVNCLRNSYMLDRTRFNVLESLLETLESQDKYSEMLVLIQDHKTFSAGNVPKSELVALLWREANLWSRCLKRPDIAIDKLQSALEMATDNIEMRLQMIELTAELGPKDLYYNLLDETLLLAKEAGDLETEKALSRRLNDSLGFSVSLVSESESVKLSSWAEAMQNEKDFLDALSQCASEKILMLGYRHVFGPSIEKESRCDLRCVLLDFLIEKYPNCDLIDELLDRQIDDLNVSSKAFEFRMNQLRKLDDSKAGLELYSLMMTTSIHGDDYLEMMLRDSFLIHPFDRFLDLVQNLDGHQFDQSQKDIEAIISKKMSTKSLGDILQFYEVLGTLKIGTAVKNHFYGMFLQSECCLLDDCNEITSNVLSQVLESSSDISSAAEEILFNYCSSLSDITIDYLIGLIFEDSSFVMDLSKDYEILLQDKPEAYCEFLIRSARQCSLEYGVVLSKFEKVSQIDSRRHFVDQVFEAAVEMLADFSAVDISNLDRLRNVFVYVRQEKFLLPYLIFWSPQNISPADIERIRDYSYDISFRLETRAEFLSRIFDLCQDLGWRKFIVSKLYKELEGCDDLRWPALTCLLSKPIEIQCALNGSLERFSWLEAVHYQVLSEEIRQDLEPSSFKELIGLMDRGRWIVRENLICDSIIAALRFSSQNMEASLLHLLESFGDDAVVGSICLLLKDETKLASDQRNKLSRIVSGLNYYLKDYCHLEMLLVSMGGFPAFGNSLCEQFLKIAGQQTKLTMYLRFVSYKSLKLDQLLLEFLRENLKEVQESLVNFPDSVFTKKAIEEELSMLENEFSVQCDSIETQDIHSETYLDLASVVTVKPVVDSKQNGLGNHAGSDAFVSPPKFSLDAIDLRPQSQFLTHWYAAVHSAFEQLKKHRAKPVERVYKTNDCARKISISSWGISNSLKGLPIDSVSMNRSDGVKVHAGKLGSNYGDEQPKTQNPVPPALQISQNSASKNVEDVETFVEEGTQNIAIIGALANETRWQDIVLKGKILVSDIDSILKADISKIDRHVGLQVLSLLAGSVKHLENYRVDVWRNFRQRNYNLDFKSRFPDSAISKRVISESARAVADLNSFFATAFPKKITLAGLSELLDVSESKILSSRIKVDWSEKSLARTGLESVAESMSASHYVIYGLDGLSQRIFYDAGNRSLYIDFAYYKDKPQSHLFHRLLEVYWSIRLKYYVFLSLAPGEEIVKSIDALSAVIASKKLFSKKIESEQLSAAKRFIDIKQSQKVEIMLREIKGYSSKDFKVLQSNFRSHLHKIMLAQTLDFVGISEALADRDFLISPPSSVKDYLSSNKHMEPLLSFCLKIDLEGVNDTSENLGLSDKGVA